MGLNEVRHDNARGAAGPTGARQPSPVTPQPSAAQAFRVDIGELVLDGFGPRVDPDRVRAAFQAELTRLVRERGVPLAANGEGHVMEALTGLPALPATTSPGRLGEALARSVHAGLSGRGEATAGVDFTERGRR